MIDQFRGEYRFLSNFAPVWVTLDGITYPSVEHAYQAAKTLDPRQRAIIQRATRPGDAKRLGCHVTTRTDWDEIKLDVMEMLLDQKFRREPYRTKLLSTRPQDLVEGNTWGDQYWGVNLNTKQGSNHLGRLLMLIRDDLSREEEAREPQG